VADIVFFSGIESDRGRNRRGFERVLSPSRKCFEAEQEANAIVGEIRRKIVKNVKDTILWLYHRYYRPILSIGCTNASLGHSWNITYR